MLVAVLPPSVTALTTMSTIAPARHHQVERTDQQLHPFGADRLTQLSDTHVHAPAFRTPYSTLLAVNSW